MTTLAWADCWSGRTEYLDRPVVQMSDWTVGSTEFLDWTVLVRLVSCWKRSAVNASELAICIVSLISHPHEVAAHWIQARAPPVSSMTTKFQRACSIARAPVTTIKTGLSTVSGSHNIRRRQIMEDTPKAARVGRR